MNTAPLQPLFLLRPGIRLVLASASPRRRQFMDEWGLPYTIVRPTGVEPRPEHGETPAAYALRAATAKARAVAASADAGADDLILAADTVVALGHDILGKPADDADALDMLRRLSGREHEVITGVCCLFPDGSSAGFADTSAVRFHAWPEDVLRAYVRSGEPADNVLQVSMMQERIASDVALVTQDGDLQNDVLRLNEQESVKKAAHRVRVFRLEKPQKTDYLAELRRASDKP